MKHRLPGHVAPEKYEIVMKPDLGNFTFSGKEKIYIKIKKPTNQLILHANQLRVQGAGVRVKGRHAKARVIYDKRGERVILSFNEKIPAGRTELDLEFTGVLNDQMRGFYRSSYSHKGKQKFLATTQFESTDARRAFPCFDEPSHKAVFDVTMIVPTAMTAISNTLPVEASEYHEQGYKVVKFAPTPKMSTYLLAFIVGDFEFIPGKTKRGVEVRVFVTPGKTAQAKFALKVAIQTLDFFEKYFDIEYPLPILDMIAIPDFSAGAMENWGAVTYRETALLLDEEHSSASSRQWVASVIAHELAHQWFGNLVTMEWWTHLWLNEGFASYISYLAVDHIFPEWDMWVQFVVQDLNPALHLDSLKNTHPIEVEVGHPSEISEIFDQISYDKGASVIRMLAGYLGEKDFRDGLRHYLKKHSYSNARTEDLWAAFEKASGKPVRKMMQNWTKKPGYPVVKVTEGTRTIKVSQSRYYSSPLSKKGSRDTTLWLVPLSYWTGGDRRAQILLAKKSQTISKPKKFKQVKFNVGETAVARVAYPSQLLTALKPSIASKELDPVDRLGVIRDAFAMAHSGDLPTAESLFLAQSYKNEDQYPIWTKLASGLAEVADLFAQAGVSEEINELARELFGPIAKKMGWNVPKNEKHTKSLLRSLVLYSLGHFGDRSTVKKAQTLFRDSVRSKRHIHPDLRGVVYNLVAENGGAKEHALLIKMYRSAGLQEEKDRIARALGKFKQRELLKKTLHFAFDPEVKPQDTPFVVAGVTFNPVGGEIAWAFIKKNWNTIYKRYSGGGHLLPRFMSPLASLASEKHALDIEKFFKKHRAPGAKRTIQQTLESIRANAAWVERDKKSLKFWLTDI